MSYIANISGFQSGIKVTSISNSPLTLLKLAQIALLFAIMAFSLFSNSIFADEISDRAAYWESKALLCEAIHGGVKFPSKSTGETNQPCNDGDMTLFNGLLCAAGDERGCLGVSEAQDPATGEWFRSPRIRFNGNDRGGSSFSPDMALGVQLYLIKKKDVIRAKKWLIWLNELVPCSIEDSGNCKVRGLPRFCSDDSADKGCTMRPGDAAQLSATINFLQKNAGLEDLPDGRLRGYLGTFSGYGPSIVDADSRVNKPGYSQHLVGVSILLMRLSGQTDSRIGTAATRLAEKNPNNAFYTYLNDGKTKKVRDQMLNRCPSATSELRPPFWQWQWEREDSDKAWEQSCFWDCIFMAELLN